MLDLEPIKDQIAAFEQTDDELWWDNKQQLEQIATANVYALVAEVELLRSEISQLLEETEPYSSALEADHSKGDVDLRERWRRLAEIVGKSDD